MPDFRFEGPTNAAVAILLGHGAGGAMDSASMNACTKAFPEAGLCVVRFEFAYMAASRTGHKKPPPYPYEVGRLLENLKDRDAAQLSRLYERG